MLRRKLPFFYLLIYSLLQVELAGHVIDASMPSSKSEAELGASRISEGKRSRGSPDADGGEKAQWGPPTFHIGGASHGLMGEHN